MTVVVAAKRRGATPSLSAASERLYRRRRLPPHPTPTPCLHRSRLALEVGVRGRGRLSFVSAGGVDKRRRGWLRGGRSIKDSAMKQTIDPQK